VSEWRRFGKGRRDLAEPDVIKAFRKGGASVRQLTGKDTPDLLVGYLGADHSVEVKTNNAKLRPGQKRLAETWLGAPPVVARTPAQARKWLAIWRERADSTRIHFPGGGPWAALEEQSERDAAPRRAGKDEEAPA
jgi:hypothetical protein